MALGNFIDYLNKGIKREFSFHLKEHKFRYSAKTRQENLYNKLKFDKKKFAYLEPF